MEASSFCLKRYLALIGAQFGPRDSRWQTFSLVDVVAIGRRHLEKGKAGFLFDLVETDLSLLSNL
jgi:hypothetical protein